MGLMVGASGCNGSLPCCYFPYNHFFLGSPSLFRPSLDLPLQGALFTAPRTNRFLFKSRPEEEDAEDTEEAIQGVAAGITRRKGGKRRKVSFSTANTSDNEVRVAIDDHAPELDGDAAAANPPTASSSHSNTPPTSPSFPQPMPSAAATTGPGPTLSPIAEEPLAAPGGTAAQSRCHCWRHCVPQNNQRFSSLPRCKKILSCCGWALGGCRACSVRPIAKPRHNELEPLPHMDRCCWRRSPIQVTPMEGHNPLFAAMGSLLLWVGWYGFNAAPAIDLDEESAGLVLDLVVST